MSQTHFRALREHKGRAAAKWARIRGLEDLYATYEEMGWHPSENPVMKELKRKISGLRAQYKAMGHDVDPSSASMRVGRTEGV